MNADASREAGFALLTAVLFLLIVTAAITPFVLAARTRFDLAADGMRKERLDMLADGLLTVLAREVSKPAVAGQTEGFSRRSIPATCTQPGLAIEVRVQDQRGLIDLDTAAEDLLATGFRSLGLETAAAENHAFAVVASRTAAAKEADATAPTAGVALAPVADESLIADGFKQAPYETVEELYDFPALAGLPLRALAETFTVQAQQGELLAEHMPERLAAAMPPEAAVAAPATPAAPGDEAAPTTYRIDVFVRSEDRATLGYAGAMVLASAGTFALVERTASPALLPGSGGPGQAMRCGDLFGPPVAAALRGFEG